MTVKTKKTMKTKKVVPTLVNNQHAEEKVSLLAFSKNAVGIYGSYVIENRALADIRDGLKPVHRRILWTMHKLGLNSTGPTKKSARVVGDCLALYHPHGDCLAGDTLVYTLDGNLTEISKFSESDNPWVLSYDEETKQVVPARAYAFRVGQVAQTVYRLTFDDQSSLELTGNHPVFTEEHGWVNASLLQTGLTIKSCLLSYINSMVWMTSGHYNGFLHQVIGDYLYGGTNSPYYVHLNQDTLNNSPENLRVASYMPQDGTGVPLHQVKIIDIETVHYEQGVPMYDFTVDRYHNMFVATKFSQQTVSLALVHNSACYEALTNMAGVRPKNNKKDWLRKNVNIPMIEGRGNFGDHVDGPAAPRYTECKLSNYADSFLLDPDYLAVTPMLPNYSDDYLEPVILPAKLPNLLLNGSEGIAVGVSSHVPSFSFEAVKACAILALTGKLTTKSCVKTLSGNFSFPYGGFAVDESDLTALVETGQGSFVLSPEYNDSGEDFLITSVCPHFKFSKAKPAIQSVPNTAYAKDLTGDDGILFVCRSSKKLSGSMRSAWMNQIKQAIQVRVNYRMAATIRHPDGRVEFTQTSIMDVLQRWASWRIDLEKAVIAHKVKNLKKEVSKLTALIKAISNLPVVFAALEKKGTVEYENQAIDASLYHLIDNLGISLKQAELIMETKVRRLQALEKEALVKKKKELVKQVNDLNADLQDVASRIVKSL